MAQTNGVNGNDSHKASRNGGDSIPATSLLASFVAGASTKQLTPPLRAKVKEVLIDYIGVVVGAAEHASSTEPIYKAVVALQGDGNSGHCTVLAKGKPHMLPQYAGLLNATFGHSMDFDDTYAPGTLHAGVTAISAALTQAEVLGHGSSSELFMLAVAVSYEITCRLGRELGYEAYSRGMHNTSTAGVFGAVAAIAVLKNLSHEVVEMAWGLAGSKAAGSMQYLDNGSWNKRLHPGFAVHDAFMCVSLAEAGVVGASRIFEGKMGFLQAYSPNPDKDLHRLTTDLGSKWEFEKSSLKPYPACRMTHAFIEIAGALHNAHNKGVVKPDDIQRVDLTMSPSNFSLVGDPTPNKINPGNVIDAQFSAYFQTANALLYGAETGIRAYNSLEDQGITALSEKIKVATDESMKGFSARLKITWTGGKEEEREQAFPLGEPEHPYTRDRANLKFLSLAGPVYGEGKAKEIVEMIDRLEECSVEELLVQLR